jgi:TRAP-type mannitol/chloroaromatic compound transport system permease small subunit
MKIKNKKKTGILIIYSIFRILLELFLAVYIIGTFIPLFLIPTFLSIIFVLYYFYKEVFSNNEIKGKVGKIIYIYNIIYSIFILFLGCILFLEGGFARNNSTFFFIIGALFLSSEIFIYFYIEKRKCPVKTG